jgi:transposase
MIRMLIIGYCYGIRSERRLCEVVKLNLAYRWFCRLGLQDPVPEHSSFSKNLYGRFRHSDAFRHLFEMVLSRCIVQGLVGGEGFAIDASTIRADASRQPRATAITVRSATALSSPYCFRTFSTQSTQTGLSYFRKRTLSMGVSVY